METIQHNFHLSTETLEEYVLGRLPAKEVARINEHLFECDACYQMYEQETQLLTSIRTAPPAPQENPALPFWSRLAVPRGPLLAGASLVALVTLLVPRLTDRPSAPALAELTAYRSSGAASPAPANRNLVLRLDTTGLEQQEGQFRTEVADSAGKTVWSGNPVQKDGRWEVAIKEGLAPGAYWVRIYAGGNVDVLREFSLLLK